MIPDNTDARRTTAASVVTPAPASSPEQPSIQTAGPRLQTGDASFAAQAGRPDPVRATPRAVLPPLRSDIIDALRHRGHAIESPSPNASPADQHTIMSKVTGLVIDGELRTGFFSHFKPSVTTLAARAIRSEAKRIDKEHTESLFALLLSGPFGWIAAGFMEEGRVPVPTKAQAEATAARELRILVANVVRGGSLHSGPVANVVRDELAAAGIVIAQAV